MGKSKQLCSILITSIYVYVITVTHFFIPVHEYLIKYVNNLVLKVHTSLLFNYDIVYIACECLLYF